VLLRAYYATLAAERDRLPLGILNEEFVSPDSALPVMLRSVSPDLDVVPRLAVEFTLLLLTVG